jgi:hypothetical protein
MYKNLEELADKEDLDELNKLVDSLPAEEVEKYREDIVNAYMSIYQTWAFDLDCGKIENGEGAVEYMLEIIDKITALDPETSYNSERGMCYEYMAEFKDDKLVYIDKAIQEYAAIYPRLANARLARMAITHEDEYEEILEILVEALKDDDAVSSVLYTCFNIKDPHWFEVYYNKVSSILYEKDSLVKLTWVEVLDRLDVQQAQLLELLETLTDYKTENQNILNKLGRAFEHAAKKANSLKHYNYACEYFIQGHHINPAAWTFPVYATNVIKQMVRFENQPVIELYEKGLKLFIDNDTDFTLNLYWSEYLLDYARVAHNFNAPELLQQAVEKATFALQLGNGYYSSPYVNLAKATLKLGNREKCIEILRDCQKQFTSEWSTYSFEKELADEEFREIWEEIR